MKGQENVTEDTNVNGLSSAEEEAEAKIMLPECINRGNAKP
jgi:hypothetical protein